MDQDDIKKFYASQVGASVTSRLTEAALDRMLVQSVGGASVGLGVILLLLQTKLDTLALEIALYSAIFSIPAWVTAWQYVESYMFCGKASFGHFNTLKGSGVAVLFALLGMILLFVSVSSLIWHMSAVASSLFVVVSLAVGVLIFRHHNAVRRFADIAMATEAKSGEM